MLFPLLSNDNLVGILTLSKRHKGGLYNSDDIDLITTLTSEAAVAIENAQLYTQARERVNIDDLTGLYNHRYFHQRADEEISRSARFGEVFCLLSIDLDFFKTYNDVHGHLYGDEVLRNVGAIIKNSIRNIDMAFRYGGDEFSIILIQTTIDGAHRVAERIRKSLESEVDTKSRLLTCSIGIASWPADGVMREELIRKADTALYYAKRMGRNRTYLASELPVSELIDGSLSIDNKGAVLNTIYALAATVDAKDHYTYGHSKKVSKYATEIGEALSLSEERISAIHAAALLHDIGKIGVSDEILRKVGPLNDEEWEPIYAHPTMGVSILKHVESLKDCLAAVQYHHEHYDGSGYPSGLKGSNIPLDARILAVADAFDAMTSSRPYRDQKMTHEQALEEIRRCSGTHFDPEIAQIFIELKTKTAMVK
jgi:diguanylate cyclase (GGDEF)-like protein